MGDGPGILLALVAAVVPLVWAWWLVRGARKPGMRKRQSAQPLVIPANAGIHCGGSTSPCEPAPSDRAGQGRSISGSRRPPG
jgi:hypothetical protein